MGTLGTFTFKFTMWWLHQLAHHDEQTKMNHFPLVDWTCQPPPVVVAVVALPEWQGAPSSPAGEEVKREDKEDRLDLKQTGN